MLYVTMTEPVYIGNPAAIEAAVSQVVQTAPEIFLDTYKRFWVLLMRAKNEPSTDFRFRSAGQAGQDVPILKEAVDACVTGGWDPLAATAPDIKAQVEDFLPLIFELHDTDTEREAALELDRGQYAGALSRLLKRSPEDKNSGNGET